MFQTELRMPKIPHQTNVIYNYIYHKQLVVTACKVLSQYFSSMGQCIAGNVLVLLLGLDTVVESIAYSKVIIVPVTTVTLLCSRF